MLPSLDPEIVRLLIAIVSVATASIGAVGVLGKQVLKQNSTRERLLIEYHTRRDAEVIEYHTRRDAEVLSSLDRLSTVLDNHFSAARLADQEFIRLLSTQAEVMRVMVDKLLVGK